VGVVAPRNFYQSSIVAWRVNRDHEEDLIEWMEREGVSLRVLNFLEKLNDLESEELRTGGCRNDARDCELRYARVLRELKKLASGEETERSMRDRLEREIEQRMKNQFQQ
jgi:hypothetical protein